MYLGLLKAHHPHRHLFSNDNYFNWMEKDNTYTCEQLDCKGVCNIEDNMKYKEYKLIKVERV
jgi:hypothetical protein